MRLKRLSGDVPERNATPAKATNPAEWAQRKMFAKRDGVFLGSDRKLHITGIKGYPSNAGYLKWLERFKVKFDREDLLLVAAANKKEFRRIVHTEIEIEIQKSVALLVRLEQSPEALTGYISDLKANVRKWKTVLRIDPQKQREEVEKFIKETEETIAEYSTLHHRLVRL